MRRYCAATICLCAGLLTTVVPTLRAQPAEAEANIKAALPDKAFAKPEKPRKLLVYWATTGYTHESIKTGVLAMKLLGEKTGAFELTHSEDMAAFEKDSLAKFDAVLFLNTTGELFLPKDFDNLSAEDKSAAETRMQRLQHNLQEFVEGGKGLAGFHSATDTSYKWQWYGETIGGYFDGHPWTADTDVVIKIDDPTHPLAAMFEGQPLEFKEEIYQMKAPYSREKQRVLLSLDTSRTNMKRDGLHRTDGDFAVAWVKTAGKGRVFYCSLGHNHHIYWNPKVLKHYLAGLQYVLGDLKVDANPNPPRQGAGSAPPDISETAPDRSWSPGTFTGCMSAARESIWLIALRSNRLAQLEFPIVLGGVDYSNAFPLPDNIFVPEREVTSNEEPPIFNGRDLTGWKGLVSPDGGPPARAKMSPDELAKAQAAADTKMREHWKAENGVLVFDGKGDSICTAKEYTDIEMKVDWKIEPHGDSGVYLRGSPQVQIWDAGQHPEGSGGLYNNQHNPAMPLVRADKPIGEWNAFRIRMAGERVDVWLNDQLVVDNTVLENYWERGKPIYPSGQIELQNHGSHLWFRNIALRELSPSEVEAAKARPTWRELFNGKDTTGWQTKGGWVVEEGALARKGGGDIWTADPFGDFTLECEFKLDKETNSGIFFRTADINDAVQTGIELQILDSFGKSRADKHDCGAIYDCLAPSKNTVRKPGEWNHVVLTCKGPLINVMLNGDQVIETSLDAWSEAGKNPDGTDNKFRTAYKDMPRKGYIGFQDHGKPVWYRNVRIKPM